MTTVEAICAIADNNGYGPAFRSIIRAVKQHGLVVRPHTRCIRFAPPEDKRRYLLTIWADPPGTNGGIQYDIYPAAFSEFYLIPLDVAKKYLGDTDLYEVEEIAPRDVPRLIAGIDTVFEIIRKG